jgi:hypothetical protein
MQLRADKTQNDFFLTNPAYGLTYSNYLTENTSVVSTVIKVVELLILLSTRTVAGKCHSGLIWIFLVEALSALSSRISNYIEPHTYFFFIY